MGIDFHNTGYGKRFFEHQLPALIAELAGLRAGVAELTRTIAERADSTEPRTNRRTLLAVHHGASMHHVFTNAFSPEHDVHVARTYATAAELLDLHDVDTLVVDAETGWAPSGPPLVDVARAKNGECLCIAMLGANGSKRAAFGTRRGVQIVLDDRYPIALVQALRGYLR